MVERFKQQQLASSQVGLPREDKSLSGAAGLIAEAANKQRDTVLQEASQQFAQAESSFTQLSRNAATLEYALNAAREKEANEQRQLKANLSRLDEDDVLNGNISGLKQTFASDPQMAVSEFHKQIPEMRNQFNARYQDDPKLLRMMLPTQRQAEHIASSELQSWAAETTTKNLNSQLQLLPTKLAGKIDTLSGTPDEQLDGYKKLVESTNSVYDFMQGKALTPAESDTILEKKMELNKKSAGHFAEHLMAQIPDGEDGLKYIDTLTESFKNPERLGVAFSADDQRKNLEHLHSLRNGQEAEIISDIQGNSTLNVIDANRLKSSLYNAANDPKAMTAIGQEIQGRLTDLDDRITAVSKEPDSRIKTAKLSGLKQEQGAFISELGLDLKLARNFDQLQRTLTTFAQGQLKFQQGQMQFNRQMDERMARDTQVEQKKEFNQGWAQTLNSLHSTWSLPPGPKQRDAISKIVSEAMPRLNAAVTSGTISPESYGGFLNQLQKQSETAALTKIAKPFQTPFGSFGGGEVQILKGADKKKAEAAAQAQFAEIVKQERGKFVALQSAMGFVDTNTVSKGEKERIKQFVSVHMPSLLDSPAYKRSTPQTQQKMRNSAILNTIKQFREGSLNE